MMQELAATSPTLAAGWALIYLLMGGGLFGAAVIFFGLKAIGR